MIALPTHHHDDRVGQRAAHLGHEFRLALAVFGEAVEHRLERAGRLARPHHSDVKVGKYVADGRERVGQRRALAHALAHLRDASAWSPAGRIVRRGRRARRPIARPRRATRSAGASTARVRRPESCAGRRWAASSRKLRVWTARRHPPRPVRSEKSRDRAACRARVRALSASTTPATERPSAASPR